MMDSKQNQKRIAARGVLYSRMRFLNKGHVKFAILIISVILTLTVIFSDVLYGRFEDEADVGPRSTHASFQQTRTTKSLADLPRVPELSDHVLMFNRIPKSGSEIFVLFLQKLQGNKFVHVRLGNSELKQMNRTQQKVFVGEVMTTIRNKAVPISFDRIVYFTNFTEFGVQSPIYFSVIRDPYENVMSRLQKMYKKTTTMDMMNSHAADFANCLMAGLPECPLPDGGPYIYTIPYFCGHDMNCMDMDRQWALNKAKENVDRYYPVVGVLEQLNETLKILENELPLFFKGVRKLYTKDLSAPFKKNDFDLEIEPEIEEQIRNSLSDEYDFYNWIKERLYRHAITQKSETRQNYEAFLRYQ